MSLKKSIFIIVLVLLIDQISKIYIKTNFSLGDGVVVFDWFRIVFVENDGMAWGAKIPGQYGKLFLTLFRLIAIVGIGYWLWDSIRQKASKILITSIALIFAGALGNIIDSVIYGLIFNDSHHQIASLFPADGGVVGQRLGGGEVAQMAVNEAVKVRIEGLRPEGSGAV